MKKLLILCLYCLLVGCATEQISDRCQRYNISGDNVTWKPIKFSQSESAQNILYIEIPKTANYIPKLEVVDVEFDQPYKIDYTFNNQTHRFEVEDNHDQYLLYRETYDGMEKEKVYLTCNRQVLN